MKIKVFVGVALCFYLIAVVSILTSAFIINENKKDSSIAGKIADKSGGAGGSSSGVVNYLTVEEVAKHSSGDNCWIIISNKVYNVSAFLNEHPGGASSIIPYCGKEASAAFATKDKNPKKDHSKTAYDMLANYYVGDLGSELPKDDTGLSAGSQDVGTTNKGTSVAKPPAITVTTKPLVSAVSSSLALTSSEVASHNTLANCWLVISGNVYNITSYISQHPGGAQAILNYCGKDATAGFQTKDKSPASGHSQFASNLLGSYFIGNLGSSVALNSGSPGGGTPVAVSPPLPTNVPNPAVGNPVNPNPNPNPNPSLVLSSAEVASHNTLANCWLIVSGKVYDVTRYIVSHPGGAQAILNFCGKDGTNAFQTKGGKGSNHSNNAYNLLAGYLIGTLGSSVPVNPPAPGQPPGTNSPVPTPITAPPVSGCGGQGTLPSGVSAKYPGATITKQSIGGDCKQELKILYNGECRSIHTNSDGSIKEDGKC